MPPNRPAANDTRPGRRAGQLRPAERRAETVVSARAPAICYSRARVYSDTSAGRIHRGAPHSRTIAPPTTNRARAKWLRRTLPQTGPLHAAPSPAEALYLGITVGRPRRTTEWVGCGEARRVGPVRGERLQPTGFHGDSLSLAVRRPIE